MKTEEERDRRLRRAFKKRRLQLYDRVVDAVDQMENADELRKRRLQLAALRANRTIDALRVAEDSSWGKRPGGET